MKVSKLIEMLSQLNSDLEIEIVDFSDNESSTGSVEINEIIQVGNQLTSYSYYVIQ
ncbi:hypothetical protein [Paenibacillus sp. FSL H7-0326]|uniref:hypothetical protein n=1 Tax=Paenibacillus sp. FSL H7-0326 TaxID=1921144 RepID=UPI00091F4088|nr:hypothetical protein [Paenibacillus sp. FSL H7-0326]SGI70309.1 Uncharacterised protein [Mycobacterium tuberculosis]